MIFAVSAAVPKLAEAALFENVLSFDFCQLGGAHLPHESEDNGCTVHHGREHGGREHGGREHGGSEHNGSGKYDFSSCMGIMGKRYCMPKICG